MLIAGLAIHLVVTLIAAGHVLLQDKQPSVQLAWIFGIAAVPVLGIACYLLIGSDRLLLRRERRRARYRPLGEAAFRPTSILPDGALGEHLTPTFRALARLSSVPTAAANEVEILREANEFYPRLRTAIDAAQEQLWLCFYVWRNDRIGREFVQQVAAAARRGVEVRVLVDEVGSGHTPHSLFDELIAAGGRFSWATTLFPRRNRWFVNLRNHRKIVSVDGELAFVGGMNIGCEYVDGVGGNAWNDIQLAVRGPSVTQLSAVFADDWHFATGEKLTVVRRAEPIAGGIPAQLVAGGPDHQPSTTARSVEALIHTARRSVVLTTPYFVPDEGLLFALELAAARGVRVQLYVSAETDMGPLLLLSRSFFPGLLTAGVEVMEYGADIHHAKLLLVDDELALVGSINLDVRSLNLNYEVSLAIPDRGVVGDLKRYLAERTRSCTVLERERFANRPLKERLREGILRLIAPLL